MKDYLVVFTEGVDKYNLEKQLKNFNESYIARYNCKPDFDLLYENAKWAYEHNYDSFHYITESLDWQELDLDFKKEFYMFESAGVIKGNYGKSKFYEADTANNQQGASPQGSKPQKELLAIFPANYARFKQEVLDADFVQALNQSFADPSFTNKVLLLPALGSQEAANDKSIGLSAGEAYALFNDVCKNNKINVGEEYLRCGKADGTVDIISSLKFNPQTTTILGPNDLVTNISRANKVLNGAATNVNPNLNAYFASYKDSAERNLQFTKALEEYVNNLRNQVDKENLNQNDEQIVNNVGNELKTDKQKYVINCFTTAIYNQTNNIDITNNTNINVHIDQINVQMGMDSLAAVTSALLDVEGNLEATQGTIYNSAIQAVRTGARQLFNVGGRQDKFYKDAANAKGALSNLTGLNIDDSFETGIVNKNQTNRNEVENRSNANAQLNKDAELSKLNIEDAKKKIAILDDKISKETDENKKKELEKEKLNAQLQVEEYKKHQSANKDNGEIEKIKQQQYQRGQDSAGLKGNPNKNYDNMGSNDDPKTGKAKYQNAKDKKMKDSLTKKMSAKLLTPGKNKIRPLDELADKLS